MVLQTCAGLDGGEKKEINAAGALVSEKGAATYGENQK